MILASKKLIKQLLNRSGFNRALHTAIFQFGGGENISYRGAWFVCSKTNAYEEQLINGEYNEDAVIEHMIRHSPRGEGLFLDIGANIGVFALAIAQAAGLKVLAFEPEPINFMKLKKNVLLNPELDVELFNTACSDRDNGQLEFTIPFGRNRGHPFVGRYPEPPLFAWELQVPCRSIDSILMENANPQPVILFKIDVEGHEEAVLRGMKETLGRPGPIAGLIELHPHFRDVDGPAIHVFLKERGFTICEILRSGKVLPEPDPRRQDGHALWVEKNS